MSVSCMPVFRQMGRIKKVVLSQNKAPITGTIPAKRGETPPRYFFTITFGINKIIAPKIRET